MTRRILITGSCGLIGHAMTRALEREGFHVRGLDPLSPSTTHRGDVRDPRDLRGALSSCDGVLHLGAVSRVVWGERDPELCVTTNVGGTLNVLNAAAASPRRPWVVVASSREVYGQATSLPVDEDAPRHPMNVYARSKRDAEDLALAARREGVRAAVVRFSNVYGSVRDHRDRVVPAFVRAAAVGAPLRVDGADRLYDLTHLEDVTLGVLALIRHLEGDAPLPPPIHLVSGQGTTLGELAELTIALAGTGSSITEAPPRTYDVARFLGDPSRAHALLGWKARVPLREGLSRLLTDVRKDPQQ